ncbi:MAG: DUF2164 family protein [Gemmatimonadaceae bacterium]
MVVLPPAPSGAGAREGAYLKRGRTGPFLAEHGPTVYNKAIADARAFFDERSADLGAICYHEEFPLSTERKRSG